MVWEFILSAVLQILGFLYNTKPTSSDGGLQSRILYGTEAAIQDYPFFVEIRNFNYHTCGGAIISDRWILTAAHCISESAHYVVGGDVKVDSDRVIKHQSYYPGLLLNDIGLVRLICKLNFTDKVQPIRLPTWNEGIKSKILLGLGKGSTESLFSSRTPMKVNLTEVPGKNCGVPANNRIICVTRYPRPYANVCYGDSGSPLISYNGSTATVVGITSFITDSYCHANRYAGYVRVDQYVPWIHQVIRIVSD